MGSLENPDCRCKDCGVLFTEGPFAQKEAALMEHWKSVHRGFIDKEEPCLRCGRSVAFNDVYMLHVPGVPDGHYHITCLEGNWKSQADGFHDEPQCHHHRFTRECLECSSTLAKEKIENK